MENDLTGRLREADDADVRHCITKLKTEHLELPTKTHASHNGRQKITHPFLSFKNSLHFFLPKKDYNLRKILENPLRFKYKK